MNDMPLPTSRDLLRASEIAPHFGVTDGTIRAWTRTGYIVPTLITPGGHYRFSVEDVQRQLADKHTPPHHPAVNQPHPTAPTTPTLDAPTAGEPEED